MKKINPVIVFFVCLIAGGLLGSAIKPTGRSTFKLKKDEWTCTKAVQISTDPTEECLQWSKK